MAAGEGDMETASAGSLRSIMFLDCREAVVCLGFLCAMVSGLGFVFTLFLTSVSVFCMVTQ